MIVVIITSMIAAMITKWPMTAVKTVKTRTVKSHVKMAAAKMVFVT